MVYLRSVGSTRMGTALWAFWLAALLGFAAVFAVACEGSTPDGPAVTGVREVTVDAMKYTPRVLKVPAGATVTWNFTDGDTPHDVKGDGFKSDVLRSGSFTHTFATPGDYTYRCTLHPQMTGRVIVTN